MALLIAQPAFSQRQLATDETNNLPLRKVEVRQVDNAQEITIQYGNTFTQAFLSGIFCHEYTRSYTEKSSTGALYTRRYTRSVKKTRVPTEFLKQIVDENQGNLYFQPYGMGLYGRLVGELFVGNESVNLFMVKKGYCSILKN